MSGPAPARVALEVGGTHVSGALVAADGRPSGQRRHPLAADATVGEFLDALVGAARSVWAGACDCVVAIPGPFDYERGVGRYALGKFDALNGFDLGGALAARLGGTVAFLNDADAFGLGVLVTVPPRRRLVAITLGTGVGSGWIADGAIVTAGPDVPPSGDVHELVVDGAPLEDRVSRRAIRSAYRAAGGAELDVLGICALARAGDARASVVLRDAMTVLGETLAPWLTGFAAERLVVGGSMAGSWDVLGPSLMAALPGLDTAVEPDTEEVALTGAAWFASAKPRSAPQRPA